MSRKFDWLTKFTFLAIGLFAFSSPVRASEAEPATSRTELLMGIGEQIGGRVSLAGVSLDIRLPVLLPYELQPLLDAGFYFNFSETFFTLPATLGATRSFKINGFLDGKTSVFAGAAAGILFTSEPARSSNFLLLAIAGWEANLSGIRPFVQFPFGLRSGSFIAFPRFGISVWL